MKIILKKKNLILLIIYIILIIFIINKIFSKKNIEKFNFDILTDKQEKMIDKSILLEKINKLYDDNEIVLKNKTIGKLYSFNDPIDDDLLKILKNYVYINEDKSNYINFDVVVNYIKKQINENYKEKYINYNDLIENKTINWDIKYKYIISYVLFYY